VDGSAADPTHCCSRSVHHGPASEPDSALREMLAHELSSRMSAYVARIGLKQTPTYSNLQDQQHMYGDFFFVPVTSSAQVASLTQ